VTDEQVYFTSGWLEVTALYEDELKAILDEMNKN